MPVFAPPLTSIDGPRFRDAALPAGTRRNFRSLRSLGKIDIRLKLRSEIAPQAVDAFVVSVVAERESKVLRYAEIGSGDNRHVRSVEDVEGQLLGRLKSVFSIPVRASLYVVEAALGIDWIATRGPQLLGCIFSAGSIDGGELCRALVVFQGGDHAVLIDRVRAQQGVLLHYPQINL